MIITVKENDTLFSLSKTFGVPESKIASDNGFFVNDSLVVGQNLIIRKPDIVYIPQNDTTVAEIAELYGTSSKELFRNNYFLFGNDNVNPDSYVVIEYEENPAIKKIIGGYAYDFIDQNELSRTINYLTYVMPFTYGFTGEGELIYADDEKILEVAENAGVKPIMHISTLTDEGVFDSNLPTFIFSDENAKENLLNNIIDVVNQKGYYGVDVDFEFLKAEDAQNYVDFISSLADRLHSIGKILIVALPPKTSREQRGLLYEGVDYYGLGQAADYLLLMTYEWGV